ncbi:hypothetical protein ACF1HJ_30530 [Streptomyces sp. NPDC013978]|uniref:hypothetical protein n=1 Tax=Streptomyces sp. NPDC013978 TaxID=3364869 RepID=UPI003700784F
MVRRRTDEWGTDYAAQFIIGLREMHHIGLFLYDTHDPNSRQETLDLTRLLIRDNWGDGALLKFHERVKDALDPGGVIAPGKSGIWPERFRGQSH